MSPFWSLKCSLTHDISIFGGSKHPIAYVLIGFAILLVVGCSAAVWYFIEHDISLEDISKYFTKDSDESQTPEDESETDLQDYFSFDDTLAVDETEVLETRWSGTGKYGVVANGTGMSGTQTGSFTLDIPGTVVYAVLYWGGLDAQTGGDNSVTLTVDANPPVSLTADIQHGPKFWYSTIYAFTFAEDVTANLQTLPEGTHSFSVTDFSLANETLGTGLMVIYERTDLGNTYVEIKDGIDRFYCGWETPEENIEGRGDSAAQSFSITASDEPRDVSFIIFGQDMYDTDTGGDPELVVRPNALWFSSGIGSFPAAIIDSESATEIDYAANIDDYLSYPFHSSSGQQWDTYFSSEAKVSPISIPGGATYLTIQVESQEGVSTYKCASGMITAIAAAVPVPEELPPTCGDGNLDTELGEECELGNPPSSQCDWDSEECDACQCEETPPSCGDGNLDTELGEECEMGNPSGFQCEWGSEECQSCRCEEVPIDGSRLVLSQVISGCIEVGSVTNTGTVTATVNNPGPTNAVPKVIVDTLPPGITYVTGSAKFNGTPDASDSKLAIQTSGGQQQLTWTNGATGWTLTAGQSLIITFTVRSESNAQLGAGTNSISLTSSDDQTKTSTATVFKAETCAQPDTGIMLSSLSAFTTGILLILLGGVLFKTGYGTKQFLQLGDWTGTAVATTARLISDVPIYFGTYVIGPGLRHFSKLAEQLADAFRFAPLRVSRPQKYFEEKVACKAKRKVEGHAKSRGKV